MGPASNAPQILLVDDNATNLQVLYQTLEGNQYRLLAARNGKDALTIAQRARPDLILLDVMMPEMDGFETCRALKTDARTRGCAVIFLSAVTDARDKVRGLELGAVDFINKPFQAEEVLARVKTHLTVRDLQLQLQARNAELEHELRVAQELLREARDRTDGVLLGESGVAARLRQQVQDAGRCEDTLLISGPPGSDHEAVARAVHDQSARSARAILCVSCLAAAADLSAATEPGTGAIDFSAKLHLAHGGTLYLEGVQYLPRDTQRLLAQTIGSLNQGREAGALVDPDVRVIVSTTRDVDEELSAGRLDPELHRTVVKTIDLAPLRTRLEDLSTLVPYILRRQAEQTGRTVPIISPASLQRLAAHRWPGNLRELRNVLGTALAASAGPMLEIGDHLLDNGVRVGSYRLIEQLGAGGMGEVWLGKHQLLARPAAIKVVREAVIGGSEDPQTLRQRFAREAQATAQLQSPHTVRLFDFGVTDTGSFYYVMEHLRGLDLQRIVERHGPLEPERAVVLLMQACRSLSEAHALGLVHRDIKPGNLFVCRLAREYDFLKVLDFGVVSRRGRESAGSITMDGILLGTPAFLPPELISGNGSFDDRADIYAIGCVAYWLLTGRPPFEGPDAVSVLMQHTNTAPQPPSRKVISAIPAELDALVLECLAKEPDRRPASSDILSERLAALALNEPWTQRRARQWWEEHEPELID
jgi:DNA-binding NtrC family response regulator